MLDINICNHPVIIFHHDLEFVSDWMVETTCKMRGAENCWFSSCMETRGMAQFCIWQFWFYCLFDFLLQSMKSWRIERVKKGSVPFLDLAVAMQLNTPSCVICSVCIVMAFIYAEATCFLGWSAPLNSTMTNYYLFTLNSTYHEITSFCSFCSIFFI